MNNNNYSCYVPSGRPLNIFEDTLKYRIGEKYSFIEVSEINCFIRNVQNAFMITTSDNHQYILKNKDQIKILKTYNLLLKKILYHYYIEISRIISIYKNPVLVWRSRLQVSPINTNQLIEPIIEKIFKDWRVIASATNDPQIASGSANIIVNGVTNDS